MAPKAADHEVYDLIQSPIARAPLDKSDCHINSWRSVGFAKKTVDFFLQIRRSTDPMNQWP
jgi:hypothetical protein